MTPRIMQVFYGTDALPYKDKERQVHYPIVGGKEFTGASNSTEIRFYLPSEWLGATWVANVVLPNGQTGSKVLQSNTDDDGQYVSLLLTSWYTQFKGDLLISLQGYDGNIDYEYDSDNGIYTIYGTPTIQATGIVRLTISYATPFSGGQEESITLQQLLAIIAKIGERSISYVDDISSVDLSDYELGHIIYDKETNQFYEKTNSDPYYTRYDILRILHNISTIYFGNTLYPRISLGENNTLVFTTDDDNVLFNLGGGDLLIQAASVKLNGVELVAYNDMVSYVGAIANQKVDKTSNAMKLYGTDSNGIQTTLNYGTYTTPNYIVQRLNTGHISVPILAVNDTDAMSKYETDNNFGNSIDLSINPTTYVMTITLKNKNGGALSTQTVDLPLETMVVGGTYDNETKEIILTLDSGQTIEIPVGDLVSGLVSTSDLETALASYVQKTQTIAGINLSGNISAQDLTDALVYMNNTTDIDYVMED